MVVSPNQIFTMTDNVGKLRSEVEGDFIIADLLLMGLMEEDFSGKLQLTPEGQREMNDFKQKGSTMSPSETDNYVGSFKEENQQGDGYYFRSDSLGIPVLGEGGPGSGPQGGDYGAWGDAKSQDDAINSFIKDASRDNLEQRIKDGTDPKQEDKMKTELDRRDREDKMYNFRGARESKANERDIAMTNRQINDQAYDIMAEEEWGKSVEQLTNSEYKWIEDLMNDYGNELTSEDKPKTGESYQVVVNNVVYSTVYSLEEAIWNTNRKDLVGFNVEIFDVDADKFVDVTDTTSHESKASEKSVINDDDTQSEYGKNWADLTGKEKLAMKLKFNPNYLDGMTEQEIENMTVDESRKKAREFKPELQGKTVTIIGGEYEGKKGTVTSVEIFGDSLMVNIDGVDVDVEDGNYTLSNEGWKPHIQKCNESIDKELASEGFEDDIAHLNPDQCVRCGEDAFWHTPEGSVSWNQHPYVPKSSLGLESKKIKGNEAYASEDCYREKWSELSDEERNKLEASGVGVGQWNIGTDEDRKKFEDDAKLHGEANESKWDGAIEEWKSIRSDVERGDKTRYVAKVRELGGDHILAEQSDTSTALYQIDLELTELGEWKEAEDYAIGFGESRVNESGLYGYGSATGRMPPAESWNQGYLGGGEYGTSNTMSDSERDMFSEFRTLQWSELPADIQELWKSIAQYIPSESGEVGKPYDSDYDYGDEESMDVEEDDAPIEAKENWRKVADNLISEQNKKRKTGKRKAGEAEEDDYPCPACGAGFSSEEDFNNHIDNDHKGDSMLDPNANEVEDDEGTKLYNKQKEKLKKQFGDFAVEAYVTREIWNGIDDIIFRLTLLERAGFDEDVRVGWYTGAETWEELNADNASLISALSSTSITDQEIKDTSSTGYYPELFGESKARETDGSKVWDQLDQKERADALKSVGGVSDDELSSGTGLMNEDWDTIASTNGVITSKLADYLLNKASEAMKFDEDGNLIKGDNKYKPEQDDTALAISEVDEKEIDEDYDGFYEKTGQQKSEESKKKSSEILDKELYLALITYGDREYRMNDSAVEDALLGLGLVDKNHSITPAGASAIQNMGYDYDDLPKERPDDIYDLTHGIQNLERHGYSWDDPEVNPRD